MSSDNDFIDAMRADGIESAVPLDLKPDGQLHRFAQTDDKRGKRSAWYVYFTDGRLPSGAFGSWKSGVSGTWCSKQRAQFSEQDRIEWRRRKALVDAARQAEAEKTAARAATIWRTLSETGRSPYLQRKRVKAYGLRFARDGAIVIPVRDVDGKLWGLQFIDAVGGKRFLSGTAKRGRFHWLGNPVGAERLAIAEGYATAATIHEVAGWPTACAFDAGNLEPVARAIHSRHPAARIIVCGDADPVGRDKARAAALAVGAWLAFPSFSGVAA